MTPSASRARGAALALLSGCSFLGLRPTLPRSANGQIDCSDSGWSAGLDSTGASLLLVGGGWGAVALGRHCNASSDDPLTCVTEAAMFVALPSLALGTVYLASALYGYRHLSRCHKMQATEGERMRLEGVSDVDRGHWRAPRKAASTTE